MKAGRMRLRQDDRTWDVAVAADGRVEVGDRCFRVSREAGASWRLEDAAGTSRIHAVGDGDTVWVHAGGQVFVFEVSDAATARTRTHAAGDAGLSAPMPATVRAVLVAAGDAVEHGQTLVMLEAMKMELPIRAPRAGTVAAVTCQAGELVQPGRRLVEIA